MVKVVVQGSTGVFWEIQHTCMHVYVCARGRVAPVLVRAVCVDIPRVSPHACPKRWRTCYLFFLKIQELAAN